MVGFKSEEMKESCVIFFPAFAIFRFTAIFASPFGEIVLKIVGLLAQLVQSTCLTSRGSLVRIQQCPQIKSRSERSGIFLF